MKSTKAKAQPEVEETTPCPACAADLGPRGAYRGGWATWDCPNCGLWGVGDLLLDEENRPKLSAETLSRLKHLLFEQHLKGGRPPVLFERSGEFGNGRKGTWFVSLQEFLSRYPRTPLEYFDRALENIGRQISHPTGSVKADPGTPLGLFSDGDEAELMLSQLEQLGYIHVDDGDCHDDPRTVRVLPHGWERIQILERPGRDSTQAFVAMSFAASQDDVFELGLRPAIEADGNFRALRIDRKDHNNKIDDEIVAEIRRSRFVVADFTGQRGGIYYEAGFAAGIGLPVIFACRRDEIDKVHFDTRQYNHIVYDTPEHLRTLLQNRIRATIA